MRFLIVLALVAFPAIAEERPATSVVEIEGFLLAQTFTCGRKTCGQMRSCAEACHALLVCGDSRRDGDGDGIPCESLCSRRC